MTPPIPPPSRKPSELVQAAVSVALLVYLVGLVLTMASNSVSGSSALVRTIKSRLFSPWMKPAWLDLGFDHPLTYGSPEDAEHAIEVRTRVRSAAVRTFPGDRRGEQAARWRRLARSISVAAVEGDPAPLIAGVGAGSFADVGNEDVTVRVLRRRMPERAGGVIESSLGQSHAARVRRIDGDIQVIELGGAAKQAELAPVLRRSRSTPSNSAPEDDGDA
jgi:hypothetical protein